jgi:hypothetical protein
VGGTFVAQAPGMKPHRPLACVAIATALAWTSASHADETAYYEPTPPPSVIDEQAGYTGPNRALVVTGVVALMGAYVPSVIIGAESLHSTDRHLYVPVAGPWLDLADRPGCGAGSIGCSRETTNKVLLIASGALQGIGALALLASFVFPERDGYLTSAERNAPTRAAARDKPSVHVTPAEFGSNGYGVAAFGGF